MAAGESPFQMAVVGDSIVWGSGLADDDKAWSLTQAWLAQRLGRPVHTQVIAHSFAVVAPDPVKDAEPAAWGEIRFNHPSITHQALHDSRLNDPGPAAIDLVLMDGSINDVGPANLFLPWRSSQWVREQAAERCGRQMKNLLLPVLDRFTRARIVVTGYYPIVSSLTSFTGALTPLLPFRQRVIELSATWAEASNQWLRWAVQQADLHRGGPGPRVLYADPAFGPANCYAAPETYLWTLSEALGDGSPVGQRRRAECRRLRPLDPICPVDMAFHPNRRGARAYADAVIKALEPVMPASR
jgi:hypothetical protein